MYCSPLLRGGLAEALLHKEADILRETAPQDLPILIDQHEFFLRGMFYFSNGFHCFKGSDFSKTATTQLQLPYICSYCTPAATMQLQPLNN